MGKVRKRNVIPRDFIKECSTVCKPFYMLLTINTTGGATKSNEANLHNVQFPNLYLEISNKNLGRTSYWPS
jgi:hypothetical protein